MKSECIISILLITTLLASCSTVPSETAAATQITTTEAVDTAPVETASETEEVIPETTEAGPIVVETGFTTSEPEIEEDNGTSKRVTFFRDDNVIKSKVYLPEGEGPFKTVIITGGLYASLGFYSSKAEAFCDSGYAVIEMRPANNVMPSPYTEPEFIGDFVYDQMLDIFALMDSLTYFSEFDTSNLYLFGHSMGGLATVYAGVLRQDAIKGIILAEPSFQYPETMTFENGQKLPTDFYTFLADCTAPVLIITGTGERPDLNDFPHFYDNAINTLVNSQLVTVEGADHVMSGDYGIQMVEQAVTVMEIWEQQA